MEYFFYYRWNISRGITEYHSLFTILLLTYLFSITNLRKTTNLILLSFLGIINIWLREDHIFLTFFLIYFNVLNNKDNNKLYLLNFYSSFYHFTKNNFLKIFLYGFLLTVGIALLWVRNYIISESFGFNHLLFLLQYQQQQNVLDSSTFYGIDFFGNFYMLFTASLWPNIPRITSILLLGGFIISLLKLLNVSFTNKINFVLILCVLGCLIPGLIFPLIGYYPRYTIKYLPYCLIIFSILLNQIIINKSVYRFFNTK